MTLRRFHQEKGLEQPSAVHNETRDPTRWKSTNLDIFSRSFRSMPCHLDQCIVLISLISDHWLSRRFFTLVKVPIALWCPERIKWKFFVLGLLGLRHVGILFSLHFHVGLLRHDKQVRVAKLEFHFCDLAGVGDVSVFNKYWILR